MQSRLPNNDQHNTPVLTTTASQDSRQHGDENTEARCSPLSFDGSGGSDSDSQGSLETDLVGQPIPSTQIASGLKPDFARSPSNRNRIAEYENTPISGKPKKRDGGPAFEVIKKSKGSDGNGTQLLHLPNGKFCLQLHRLMVANDKINEILTIS